MQQLLEKLKVIPNKEQKENLFQLILVELQYLLFKIQFCSSTRDADEFFNIVEETQLALAQMKNRNQIELPPLLLQFIADFDDVYDQNSREQLLTSIKENKYRYGDTIQAFSKILDDIKKSILKPELLASQKQLIVKKIQELLDVIATKKQSVDADIYFEQLLAIQELLAEITFAYGIPLDEPLMHFIYDCDRLDDPQTRTDLFNRIKHDEYNVFSEKP